MPLQMETRAYDFGVLRFPGWSGSFPARFHIARRKRAICFLVVSRSFPFVSRFGGYTRETRNETGPPSSSSQFRPGVISSRLDVGQQRLAHRSIRLSIALAAQLGGEFRGFQFDLLFLLFAYRSMAIGRFVPKTQPGLRSTRAAANHST